MWRGKSDGDSAESQKNEYIQDINGPQAVMGGQEEGVDLHRGLKARHITMIGMLRIFSIATGHTTGHTIDDV